MEMVLSKVKCDCERLLWVGSCWHAEPIAKVVVVGDERRGIRNGGCPQQTHLNPICVCHPLQE